MTDEVKDPLVQAILLVQKDGLANDQALLTLGEAITEQVNLQAERIDMLIQMNLNLQNKILDLYQKVEILTEMYHTHFIDEGKVH